MKTKIFILFFIFLFSLNLWGNSVNNKRISLNLKNVDIHDIIINLARYLKKNVVIPPSVSGKVTIYLDNVTFEDALKVITNISGYAYYCKDNIIFIDKKENVEKIKGKENIKSKIFYLNFSKAEDIKEQVQNLLSKDGKVIVDTRTNSLLVQDFIGNISKIENFIKNVDKPTKQVMIEAKIVVMNSDASKELGIQWGGSYVDRLGSSNFFYGIKGGTSYTSNTETGETTTTTTTPSINSEFPGAGSITNAIPSGVSSTSNLQEVSIPSDYIVNLPTISAPAGGIGLIFGKWGFYNIAFKLTALKSKNLAKVISSPKVLVLNNEKASIGQGVEIPYKSVSDAGTETQFKDAKLKLEVTPHISANGIISIEVHLTKDSVGKITVNGEPSINTQEITTKLLVKDGETAVIGGILENFNSKSETKVPLFGDIPIFGGLFRNKINQRSNGELLIFITPKIVK